MNRVNVTDRTGKVPALASSLRLVLRKTMRALRLGRHEVTAVLLSDAAMRTLNRRWRKFDRPTDVLSFSMEPHPSRGPVYLGDLAIAVPTARRQAKLAGHSLHAECAMLAVHGLLHLLGHDHAEPREAKKMFDLQKRLLEKGVSRA